MRLPCPPPRSVGGRTGRPRGLCQALQYGEQDVGVGPDRTGRGGGVLHPAAMCSAMAKRPTSSLVIAVGPFSRSSPCFPSTHATEVPLASSCSPAGTPPFPQRVWRTPCQQHTRGWRHGRGGGVPGPRQGRALAGAASLRQRAATARPGPLGTGAAHAAASAPRAPRQTGSRASVVRPRSPCHD